MAVLWSVVDIATIIQGPRWGATVCYLLESLGPIYQGSLLPDWVFAQNMGKQPANQSKLLS